MLHPLLQSVKSPSVGSLRSAPSSQRDGQVCPVTLTLPLRQGGSSTRKLCVAYTKEQPMFRPFQTVPWRFQGIQVPAAETDGNTEGELSPDFCGRSTAFILASEYSYPLVDFRGKPSWLLLCSTSGRRSSVKQGLLLTGSNFHSSLLILMLVNFWWKHYHLYLVWSVHEPRHMCRGQWTACSSWFSPPTPQDMGTELRSSVLVAGSFTSSAISLALKWPFLWSPDNMYLSLWWVSVTKNQMTTLTFPWDLAVKAGPSQHTTCSLLARETITRVGLDPCYLLKL